MTDNQAWVDGDRLGIPVPADGAALLAGGPEYLTRAFRAFGTLPDGNRVRAITSSRPILAGGSGTKLLLDVEYETPSVELPEHLFVKFSRNFDDPAMDSPRFYMEPEVRFAILSRMEGFPIDVPACMFADFHHETGTGMMITAQIPFGQDGIEQQYSKCLDHEIDEPLEHYRVFVAALGRLAGSHKGGRLPPRVADEFPFDHAKALKRDRLPSEPGRLAGRVARYREFALAHPRLLPAEIRSEEFLASFAQGPQLFLEHEDAIKQLLHGQPDFIALCHWNANIDNGWFWRDAEGALHCGMFDWASVGQIHLGMVLWGCLSGAEQWLWRDHLDELLADFACAFHEAGGPVLDLPELKLHLLLYAAMMGLVWLMDAPPRIRREVPDLAECSDRLDPRILASETARVQLQMMTNFIALWQREDLTARLQDMFATAGD